MKINDRVIKARQYSKKEYCYFGGSKSTVPIGMRGTVTNVIKDKISVQFDNGNHWSVHIDELDLAKAVDFSEVI